MAGVMTTGDEGTEVKGTTVPTMGSLDGIARVASNPDDGLRANGVNYDSSNSAGVNLTTSGYPTGSVMKDMTPGDDVN
jgi:hypothetical protein